MAKLPSATPPQHGQPRLPNDTVLTRWPLSKVGNPPVAEIQTEALPGAARRCDADLHCGAVHCSAPLTAIKCRSFVQSGGAGRVDQTIADQSLPSVVVPRRGLILIAALIATFIPAVESS